MVIFSILVEGRTTGNKPFLAPCALRVRAHAAGMAAEEPLPGSHFTTKPSLSDFILGPALGEGALCTVRTARFAATGARYAIKAVSKARLRRMALRNPAANRLLLQERLVGARVGGAMGAVLHATFQDAESVFYVYDRVGGGELWEVCMEGTWARGAGGGRPAAGGSAQAGSVLRAGCGTQAT